MHKTTQRKRMCAWHVVAHAICIKNTLTTKKSKKHVPHVAANIKVMGHVIADVNNNQYE